MGMCEAITCSFLSLIKCPRKIARVVQECAYDIMLEPYVYGHQHEYYCIVAVVVVVVVVVV